MKYIDEYRDFDLVKRLSDEIIKEAKNNWTIMEICGGQTHSIMKFGIDELIPKKINLIHGPGCPVCVTPLEFIDKALKLAGEKNVIFTSFGDMLRVPGSKNDLLTIKASHGDVRMLYTPLDAIKIAKENPQKEVVFFSVGFETTAPISALAVKIAKSEKLKNFSLLVSHVLVPPAINVLLSSKSHKINGFLAAGHVCTIMGYKEYEPIAKNFNVPITVTGFEPLDILTGILFTIRQLEKGSFQVENAYGRSVKREGNLEALKTLKEVFKVVSRKWRGIGEIPNSGYSLNKDYEDFDAEKRFGLTEIKVEENPNCISGLILQGIKKPNECPMFLKTCTPESPLGATMVSSEGACSAYYKYKSLLTLT